MADFKMDNYVTVAERLRLALEKYPELSVQESRPTVVSMDDGKQYLEVTTRVWRHPQDPLPIIVSCWEEYPGTTSFTRGAEQPNASTSSLGRALGMLGFGIKQSIASRDDVERRQPAPVTSTKVITSPETGEKTTITRVAPIGAGGATPAQMGKIRALAGARGHATGRGVTEAVSAQIGRKIVKLDELTKAEASAVLDAWKVETPALIDEEPF